MKEPEEEGAIGVAGSATIDCATQHRAEASLPGWRRLEGLLATWAESTNRDLRL